MKRRTKHKTQIPKVTQREMAQFVREWKRELRRVAATGLDGGSREFASRVCSQSPYDNYASKMLRQCASPVSRTRWNAALSSLHRDRDSRLLPIVDHAQVSRPESKRA